MDHQPLAADEMLYDDDDPMTPAEMYLGPAATPDSQDKAAWHNRKADAIRRQLAAERAVFEAEIERVRERMNGRAATLTRQAEWHEKAVESWHRAHAKTVGKTVHFPTGRPSTLRGRQPKAEIYDEDAFRAWLVTVDLEDKIYVAKEPVLSKEALKKELAKEAKKGAEPGSVLSVVHPETGEVAPGVRFRVLGDRWSGTDKETGQ